MTFTDVVFFLRPTRASTDHSWPGSHPCWSWLGGEESREVRGCRDCSCWTPAGPGSGWAAACGPGSARRSGTGSWRPPARSGSSRRWLWSDQRSGWPASAAASLSCKTQPSPGCQPSPAWSRAAAGGTPGPAGTSAARCRCWFGLCAVSQPSAFSAGENKKRKHLVHLNLFLNIIWTNLFDMSPNRRDVYLMSRSEMLLRVACLSKNSGSHRCSVSVPVWRASWVWAAFSSASALYLYAHISIWMCGSWACWTFSQSLGQWERWEGLWGTQGCHMLNEVFIAVGTMSVSPGSRWRNRLGRERAPGCREGGGGGGV